MARASQRVVSALPTGTLRAAATYLLDVNVLVALAWPQHVHHKIAHVWFDKVGSKRWASCPLTQLAFVRISSNPKIIVDAASPRAALKVLTQMTALEGHQFWPDDLPLNSLTLFNNASMTGHRQVTDVYLLELTMRHHSVLATLDHGLNDFLMPTERSQWVELIK